MNATNWRIEEFRAFDRVGAKRCARRFCQKTSEVWVVYDFDQYVTNRGRTVQKSPRRGYCREHANDMMARHAKAEGKVV